MFVVQCSLLNVKSRKNKIMTDYYSYITSDKNIRFGRPCIKGTRIAVEDVIQWIAAGMSVTKIIYDFPELTEKQINACIEYDRQTTNSKP